MNRRRVSILAAIAMGAAAGPAAAQEAPPISLEFSFGDGALADAYKKAARPAAEKRLTDKLGPILHKALKFWPVNTGPSTQTLKCFPKAEPSHRWSLILALSGEGASWSQDLYGPAAISMRDGIPETADIEKDIVGVFEQLMTKSRPIIVELAKVAPLATEAKLDTFQLAAFRPKQRVAVLPLDWGTYCRLAENPFLIFPGTASGGGAIDAKGLRQAGSWIERNIPRALMLSGFPANAAAIGQIGLVKLAPNFEDNIQFCGRGPEQAR